MSESGAAHPTKVAWYYRYGGAVYVDDVAGRGHADQTLWFG